MLIPSTIGVSLKDITSLSRRVNANSQPRLALPDFFPKLIKKGEC